MNALSLIRRFARARDGFEAAELAQQLHAAGVDPASVAALMPEPSAQDDGAASLSPPGVFTARRGNVDGALHTRYQYALVALYERVSRQFFGNRLPHPERARRLGGPIEGRGIFIRRVPRRRLKPSEGCAVAGRFRPPGPRGPAVIQIANLLVPADERRALTHQAIHVFLWLTGVEHEAHGPAFVAELDRLAASGEAWAGDEAARYRASQARKGSRGGATTLGPRAAPGVSSRADPA